MRPQSVIIPKPTTHSLFLTFAVKDKNRKLASTIVDIDKYVTKLKKIARVNNALSFGEAYWKAIAPTPEAIPKGIRTFSGIDGDYSVPATGGDLFLHLNSRFADLNYEVAHNWFEPLKNELQIIHEQACTRYLGERDLIGFIDGTENPKDAKTRKEVALLGVSDGNRLLAGSSFTFVQGYKHKLNKWKTLTVLQQEYLIGRTKEASLELGADRKPPTAHISRVVIKEDGEELEIVRHSMPYFSVKGSKGLIFIAYTKDLDIIEKMLARMYGKADRLHDHLMDYTTPTTGAMFFTPSQELLDSLKI